MRFLLFLPAFFAFSVFAQTFSKADGPDNFGVLVHNDQHTIYRSGALGKRGLARVWKYLDEHDLPRPKTVIHMNRQGYGHIIDFAIEEYKARQAYGFEFYHSYRYPFRTYLDGHDPYRPTGDIDRPVYLTKEAETLFGFRTDGKPDGGMDAFYRILDLILSANGPVLFHCTGGMHRTGMVAMAIRYIQSPVWRVGSYRRRGKILNAAQYEYTLHNPIFFRAENLEFVDQWALDPQFLEYVTRYRDSLAAP